MRGRARSRMLIQALALRRGCAKQRRKANIKIEINESNWKHLAESNKIPPVESGQVIIINVYQTTVQNPFDRQSVLCRNEIKMRRIRMRNLNRCAKRSGRLINIAEVHEQKLHKSERDLNVETSSKLQGNPLNHFTQCDESAAGALRKKLREALYGLSIREAYLVVANKTFSSSTIVPALPWNFSSFGYGRLLSPQTNYTKRFCLVRLNRPVRAEEPNDEVFD